MLCPDCGEPTLHGQIMHPACALRAERASHPLVVKHVVGDALVSTEDVLILARAVVAVQDLDTLTHRPECRYVHVHGQPCGCGYAETEQAVESALPVARRLLAAETCGERRARWLHG